jgi:hypothetical protein
MFKVVVDVSNPKFRLCLESLCQYLEASNLFTTHGNVLFSFFVFTLHANAFFASKWSRNLRKTDTNELHIS